MSINDSDFKTPWEFPSWELPSQYNPKFELYSYKTFSIMVTIFLSTWIYDIFAQYKFQRRVGSLELSEMSS